MKPRLRQRIVSIEKRAEGDKQVYAAALSSELPVKRGGYTEVLEHSADAINLERASNGLVLLFNHDMDKPIGRVAGIGLRNDNKLSGDFVFSDDADGQRIKHMVDEGTLTDISIRYTIDEETQEDKDGERIYTATRWTPLEASVVTIPADHTVGIGRQFNHEETEGTTMTTQTAPQGEQGNAESVVQLNFDSARKAGQGEGVLSERQRVADIESLFSEQRYQGPTYQALKRSLIGGGDSVDSAMRKLLSFHGQETDDDYTAPQEQTERGAARHGGVRIKEAAEDKQIDGIRKAMDIKLKLATEEEVREFSKGNQFINMTLGEMARHTLTLQGVDNPYQWDLRTAVGYALNPLALPYGSARSLTGHGTSVFTSLAENSIGKQLLKGFEEAGETWMEFCQVGSVSSFRAESRIDLSEFPDLDVVPENGEYTHGTMSDSKESIQATKKGKLMSVTREMIVNDDLSGLMKIPRAMGRSAARKVGDDVYSVLTTNAAMSDGTALFHANHANLRSSGAAPSVTELDAMELLMAKQTDQDGNGSGQNIDLAVLVVPRALKKVAQVLAQAVNDPDQKSTQKGGGGTVPNPFAGNFKVVADARLDATSAAVYYGMGDPSRFDTIEVGFLNGQQAPYLESENGFTVDGITYKVRHEYGVKATSWRAMVKNNGA